MLTHCFWIFFHIYRCFRVTSQTSYHPLSYWLFLVYVAPVHHLAEKGLLFVWVAECHFPSSLGGSLLRSATLSSYPRLCCHIPQLVQIWSYCTLIMSLILCAYRSTLNILLGMLHPTPPINTLRSSQWNHISTHSFHLNQILGGLVSSPWIFSSFEMIRYRSCSFTLLLRFLRHLEEILTAGLHMLSVLKEDLKGRALVA